MILIENRSDSGLVDVCRIATSTKSSYDAQLRYRGSRSQRASVGYKYVGNLISLFLH